MNEPENAEIENAPQSEAAGFEERSLSALELEQRRAAAARSTGPRTPAGKAAVSHNSLKHGRYASSDSHVRLLRASMSELGEDPGDYARLEDRIARSFRPSTPAQEELVREIASLHWDRRRLERGHAALLARRLQKLEVKRQRKSLEVAREIDGTTHMGWMHGGGLYLAPDTPAKFQQLLDWLEQLQGVVEHGVFEGADTYVEWIYGKTPTIRGLTMKSLLSQLAARKPAAPADDSKVRQLKREIAREISSYTQQYQLYLRQYVEVTPAMRGECLVPSIDQRWLMRQMSIVDRSIECKVRLLLEEQRAEENRARRQKHDRRRASAHKSAPVNNGAQLADNK